MDREYRRIIEKAYDYCRENVNTRWILEPDGDLMGVFKGILFGTLDSQMPGTAFAFTLEIDHGNLAQPPKVHFEKNLRHPYTFNYAQNPGCYFCLPQEITCRSDMDTILTSLYLNFFLATKNGVRINMKTKKRIIDAQNKELADKLNSGKMDYSQFWNDLRAEGILGYSSQETSNLDIPNQET